MKLKLCSTYYYRQTTIDLDDPDAKKGLLWGSNYPERLEKSSDGYPYIK